MEAKPQAKIGFKFSISRRFSHPYQSDQTARKEIATKEVSAYLPRVAQIAINKSSSVQDV